jgi:hypothetical protein
METHPDSVAQQWREWARQLAGDDRADEIAGAALDAMAAGADANLATAVARLKAGRAAWADHDLLARSRWELESAQRLAATLAPGPELTPAALEEMRFQLSRRLAAITPQAEAVSAGRPASAPPRPSLREFLAERSIQLLAYSGALLLAVATLLFDLSGSSPSRFLAVATLCLVFAVGGVFAGRHKSLRAVARAYIALAALLLPLVALAAYVFLGLGAAGVPRSLAVAISAGSCAATYWVLARLLASRAYAAISLLALAIFAGAAAAWLYDLRWAGAAVAGLGVACALAASWERSAREPFRLPLVAAGLALPASGVAWGLGWLFDPAQIGPVPDPPLSAALWLALAAYLVMSTQRRSLAAAAALWLPAAAFSTAHDLSLTSTQVQTVGTTVGLIWLVTALPPLDERLSLGRQTRTMLRLLAAVLLMVISWPASSGAAPQSAFALVSTAALLTVAIRSREPGWLLAAGVVATAAWYWLAQALLPPKPNATTTDLALVLSPLPVIFGAASLVVRETVSRSWAMPLYACFAILGLGVAAIALVQPGWLVAGGCLLIYAALGYAIALLEREVSGVAVALLAALAGVGCLLAAANSKGDYYLVGLAGFGVVIYLIGLLLGTLAGPVHRYLAQACLVLAAMASVFSAVSPATIALCSLAAAAVLGLDAWLSRAAPSEYLAAMAASLLAVALVRQLAVRDLLYQVAVPGVALIAAGARVATDERLPERVLLARLATAAGCLIVLGTTAYLSSDPSASSDARSAHTAWLTVEAAAGLVAAVGLRSRTLAIASAVALGWAALMAASLLAAVVPLSLIFGVVAVTLILVATGLALLRGALGSASDSARTAWSSWI